MRLLVVEDDALTAHSLLQALSTLGHTVDSFATFQEAQAALAVDSFDLVVLDLGLPDGDGLQLLADLRHHGATTPVLVLTARDDIRDRVKGLDHGADDYMAKPFSLAELEARVRALLRRSQHRPDNDLSYGPLCLDHHSGMVVLAGTPLTLRRREVSLLEGLMLHAERVTPREILEKRVFGFDAVGPNALDVYISRLRKQLHGSGLRIQTLRGLGYRLEREQPPTQ